MLVYGDRERTLTTREKAQGIVAGFRDLTLTPAGIERHGELVALFIEAGELAQGVADRNCTRIGQDADTPEQSLAQGWVSLLAQQVVRSWTRGFEISEFPQQLPGVDHLLSDEAEITCRGAEGFAFYALYPEAYALAASRSGLEANTCAIGIRSAGLPLAAVVQQALGSPAGFTVRPVGHPFHRELRLDKNLTARMVQPGRSYAIVDEGPGLSGSSFGAVVDTLAQHGVPEDRMHLFPSHANEPGGQCGEPQRARWRRLSRHSVSFGDLTLHAAGPHNVADWMTDLLGEPPSRPLDISGGGWRSLRYAAERDWPPASGHWERRKFLVEASGRRWLLKFGGLGREGQRKTERAMRLAAGGFTPPVAGWRHGFHVEQWLDEARPLNVRAADPLALASTVGRYAGFRARAFPAAAGSGASLQELMEMARINVSEAMGADAAKELSRWSARDVAELAGRVRPVEIDGRMHAWEWLEMPDGRLLKADAVDHHAGHDLVGCQDWAWDIAGAFVELDLAGPARVRLIAAAEATASARVDPGVLAILTPCYLAFQLGAFTMAAEAAPDEAERRRHHRRVEAYATCLEREVLANRSGSD